MNTLSAATSVLAHSLAWALFYSLWQGLLMYCTLFALLKALPNVSARVKYYLSASSLAALCLWFADTWVSQYQRLKGTTVFITQSGTDTGLSATYSVNTMTGETLQSPLLHRIIPQLEHYIPFIIIIYTLGLTLMLFRFLINVLQVRVLRRQGLILPEPYWNDLILQWQRQFEITRPVQLYLSRRVSVPMMLGVIRPIILLPIAAVNHLTTSQVEAILLHELAHIKRHDYLLNIFQAIAETILFFNPFVWLLSGIIRREREHCCDDLVVSSSADPLPYAKALAILESSRADGGGFTLAATGHKNQLFNRIKRIMEMKKSNINYSQLTIIVLAMLTVTFTIAMFTFTPAFAQKVKTDAADTTGKNMYHYKTVIIDKNGKKTVTEKQSSTPIKEEDDDTNTNAIISAKDSKDKKNTNTKTYTYTYTYDNDDLKDVMKGVKAAVDEVASIDFKEIDKEVDNARKEIDAVDWNEVRNEINKSLDEVNKELNDPKLSKEIKTEIKKALEQSKEAMEDAREKLDAIPPLPPMPPIPPVPPVPPMPPVPLARQFDREEAHTRSKNYESMLKKMERDGLIDRSADYKVETENGTLYINNKKQPEDVYRKYHEYLENKSISIEYTNGILKMVMHDD